jgi:DNA invertase Pin-like site-specific DNA recombinase
MDGYVRHAARPLSASWASVQQGHIRAWASDRGWRVARVFEESATGTAVLNNALRRVESGESDGLMAVRMRDLGQTLPEALRAVERVEAAGGTFVSVGDGIDLSTPRGRAIFRVLLAVAEW